MPLVYRHQLNRPSGDGFPGNCEAALVHEEQSCTTVVEQLSDLVCGERRVQGNGGISAGDDPQIDRNPARTIEGKDGTACASGHTRADAGANQPLSHAVGETAKLPIGETLDGVAIRGRGEAGQRRLRGGSSGLPLNFHRRRRRPALHRLQKATVEHKISRLYRIQAGTRLRQSLPHARGTHRLSTD